MEVAGEGGARTKHKLRYDIPIGSPAGDALFHCRRRTTVNAAEQRYFALGQPSPAAELVAFLNSLRPNTKWICTRLALRYGVSDRRKGPARSSTVPRDDPEPHAGGHVRYSADVNGSGDGFRGRGSVRHGLEDATAGSEGMSGVWRSSCCSRRSRVYASSTAAWEMNTYADFMRGRFSGVSLTRDGRSCWLRGLDPLFSSDEPSIWTVARELTVALYVGTGHRGRLYRVERNGSSKFIVDCAGTGDFRRLPLRRMGPIYAGTSPNGKVYRYPKWNRGGIFRA